MRESRAEKRQRHAEYLDGRLEMHLKESDCRKCGAENDNAKELCSDCESDE